MRSACEVTSMKLARATSALENALLAQMNAHYPRNEDDSGQMIFSLSHETDNTNIASELDEGLEFPIIIPVDGRISTQIPAHPPNKMQHCCASAEEEFQPALDIPDFAHENIDARSLLSPREISVLNLLSEGLSNKYIARELDIAEPTVKCHVKSILRKLGVRNRFEAAMWVLRARGQLVT